LAWRGRRHGGDAQNIRMTAPHGPPIGRLVVDTSYLKLAFLLAATWPKIEINGRPIKARWGQWPIDLPAGDYHLRVSTRYLGDSCPAQLPVRIYPGQQVTVYYRTPAWLFMSGAIGFQPQPTRGLGTMIGFCALIMLLGLVIVFA
jgi:hypothetical protein